MAENKIIPWAQTGTANVLSDDAYASDVAKGGLYGDGVKTGQASSQQANKTWRQATAPGSGLSQFLVDNLSVDVTDSDTPDTFSTRIANAVLKLAQVSPFNQSWATSTGGYRKYAIVSDSSGNFWVSTADQNTNVPGDDSAKWQSLFNGYATQTWANGRFQPSGDYATNPALSAEASNRARADSNLQNQVNNRVVKTGDKMTGGLTIEGSTGGFTTQYNPGSPASGSYINYPGFTSIAEGRGGEFYCQLQEHVGNYFSGLFSLRGSSGDWRYVGIPEGRRINDSQFGDVAYTNDLGNYVSQSQYQNDFLTGDPRVINLAWNHRIQVFQANVGNGTSSGSWITFPVAFSGTPVFFQANSNGNGDGSTDTDYWCYGANSTGMYVRPRNQRGSANIIVIGPK